MIRFEVRDAFIFAISVIIAFNDTFAFTISQNITEHVGEGMLENFKLESTERKWKVNSEIFVEVGKSISINFSIYTSTFPTGDLFLKFSLPTSLRTVELHLELYLELSNFGTNFPPVIQLRQAFCEIS